MFTVTDFCSGGALRSVTGNPLIVGEPELEEELLELDEELLLEDEDDDEEDEDDEELLEEELPDGRYTLRSPERGLSLLELS